MCRLPTAACRLQQDCSDFRSLRLLRTDARSGDLRPLPAHRAARLPRHDGAGPTDLRRQVLGPRLRQPFSGQCLVLVHILCHRTTHGHLAVLQRLGQGLHSDALSTHFFLVVDSV